MFFLPLHADVSVLRRACYEVPACGMAKKKKKLDLKMSLCMKIFKDCERCCDFMLAFDPVYYAVVHTLFQAMNKP